MRASRGSGSRADPFGPPRSPFTRTMPLLSVLVPQSCTPIPADFSPRPLNEDEWMSVVDASFPLLRCRACNYNPLSRRTGSRLRLKVGWIRRIAPGSHGSRSSGRRENPSHRGRFSSHHLSYVAPLELRRGELVKVVGFALQAAAAETERGSGEGAGGTDHPLR